MGSIIKRIFYLLYQPYKWFFFIPQLVISTTFFGATAWGLVYLLGPKKASFIGGAIWARLNGLLTPMFVKVTGKNRIDKKQSYVVVSNHQSQFDIFVLYGWLGIDFKWVMKIALRKVPFLGIACEKIGHIYIDRSNTEAAIKSIERAKKRIVNGTSVIFFPEGTRSKSGVLKPFKKGAFKMAMDLHLPILPITINGTCKILPTNSLDLFPGNAHMIIHPPVDISAYPKGDFRPLMDDVRSIIQSGIPKK